MPDTASLAAFVAAALALLVAPGPAVLYIVARAVDQGRLAGIVSGLGLTTGGLAHVAAVTFGLSAALAASPAAFHALRLAGAAYLVVLGVQTLRRRPEADLEDGRPPARRLGVIYRDGIVVNLLNPKAALFFFAFLPQFADPARGPLGRQLFFLGMLFLVLGLLTDFAYAMLAGTAGRWLRRSPLFRGARRWVTGSVYLALGVAAALAGEAPVGGGGESAPGGARPGAADANVGDTVVRGAEPTAGGRAPMAIVGGALWDGSGGPVVADAVVVLEGDRIAAVAVGGGERFGCLAPGRAADLLAVEADPTREPGVLERARFVVRAGSMPGSSRTADG